MKFEIGDHLMSSRIGYTHHGIYVGDGQVIHYSGLSDGLHAGPIELTTLDAFAAGRTIRIHQYEESQYNGEDAIRRAYTRLGEDRYDLQANNCEHFCTWVRTGKHVSTQVQLVETMAGAIGAGWSEFRKQRFHNATTIEAALETGKATVNALAKSANVVPVLSPLVRLLK
jgi:hypothetical protein